MIPEQFLPALNPSFIIPNGVGPVTASVNLSPNNGFWNRPCGHLHRKRNQ